MSDRKGNLRVAFYNVENLFSRPAVFQEPAIADDVFRAAARLQQHLDQGDYFASAGGGTGRTYAALIFDLMYRTYRDRSFPAIGAGGRKTTLAEFMTIRVDRGPGAFFLPAPPKTPRVVNPEFKGRDSWIGALEFARQPMTGKGIDTLIQVIREVDADILCVAEVENRRTLVEFLEASLPGVYEHVVVYDGNDRRGIDVGLVTKRCIDVTAMRSNLAVPWKNFDASTHEASAARLFDRDCFEVTLTIRGTDLHVLLNHLKSKRGSEANTVASDQRRIDQSAEVAEILRRRYRSASGWKNVIVAGDMNEHPDRAGKPDEVLKPNGMQTSIDPLLRMRAEGLLNVHLEKLPDRDKRWTSAFKPDRDKDIWEFTQIDHLFASLPVFDRVVDCGVTRSGMYLKNTPKSAESAIPDEQSAASDHAVVWMDLDWP